MAIIAVLADTPPMERGLGTIGKGNKRSIPRHAEEAMKDCRQFYIDGKWGSPMKDRDFQVINPANEEAIATISLGAVADVDRAVAAAGRAFASYSETTVGERSALLERIIAVYKAKMEEMAEAIS